MASRFVTVSKDSCPILSSFTRTSRGAARQAFLYKRNAHVTGLPLGLDPQVNQGDQCRMGGKRL